MLKFVSKVKFMEWLKWLFIMKITEIMYIFTIWKRGVEVFSHFARVLLYALPPPPPQPGNIHILPNAAAGRSWYVLWNMYRAYSGQCQSKVTSFHYDNIINIVNRNMYVCVTLKDNLDFFCITELLEHPWQIFIKYLKHLDRMHVINYLKLK